MDKHYADNGIAITKLEPGMLNTEQACLVARCGENAIVKAARNGRLPFYKKPGRNGRPARNLWYKRHDVEAWADAGKPTAALPPAQPELPVEPASVLDNLLARRLDRVEFAQTLVNNNVQVLHTDVKALLADVKTIAKKLEGLL